MGLLLSLRCAALLAFVPPAAGPSPISPVAVLAEARRIAGGLTGRTERSLAFLTLAQAQDHLGDRKSALDSLRVGWATFEHGSNQGVSKGDELDWQDLFDESDLSTLPINYAYEFVVAGDVEAARKAAMTLGNSPLADSYRQGLGTKLRAQYPETVERVTLTSAQIRQSDARKKSVRNGLAFVRAEPDAAKRSFGLFEAAEALIVLDEKAEGLALFREAAEVSKGISEPEWRALSDAQIADRLWRLGVKEEAKSLLTRAEQELMEAKTEDGRRKAHFTIEQTKETMGLPNQASSALREMERPGAAAPDSSVSEFKPAGGMTQRPRPNEPGTLLEQAERERAKGDFAAAKKTLRRIKDTPGGNGWWLVLVGEMQTKLGDREMARKNLAEASRRALAALEPAPYFNRELIDPLERIASAQVAAGDRAAGQRTLLQSLHRVVGTTRWVNIPLIGDGKERMVRHDRQSPFLHAGAVALARAGFFSDAVTMARTVPSPAHRAIALAVTVRDGFPPGSYRRPE